MDTTGSLKAQLDTSILSAVRKFVLPALADDF